MTIVKCSKCGKYIHKDSRCYHCGNNDGFQECASMEVHENIKSEYSRMELLVRNKHFSEAISLSFSIIEWMPNLAGVYWLRLLAKKKCNSALELITKGFSVDNDPDFCNALKFSIKEEKEAYIDIQNVVEEIRKNLIEEIEIYEHKLKSDTNLINVNEHIAEEIDNRKQKLFSHWIDLKNKENEVRVCELDCKLIMKEHSVALQSASQEAAYLLNRINDLKECTSNQVHEYQVKLGNVLLQSGQAKDGIENMKIQHPWVKKYSGLVAERDEIAKKIAYELESLKNYEDNVKKIISEIQKIEERCIVAKSDTEKYSFDDASLLLGKEIYSKVLINSGVEATTTLNIPIEKWSLKLENKLGSNVNEDDMEDYYTSLGIYQE